MFVEKYKPKTINEVIGNKVAISKLVEFAKAYKNGILQRPLLIYGPNGVGKTCSVEALANTFDFDLIELNASDYRDSERLKKRIETAMTTMNLFGKITLSLFDEIDELSEKFDSGAEKVIISIIQKAKQPVIFIADDFWNRKITFIRNYVEKVEFKKPYDNEIKSLLLNILRNEGKFISEDIINAIIKRSNGDVRGAINDLEIVMDQEPDMLDSIISK